MKTVRYITALPPMREKRVEIYSRVSTNRICGTIRKMLSDKNIKEMLLWHQAKNI